MATINIVVDSVTPLSVAPLEQPLDWLGLCYTSAIAPLGSGLPIRWNCGQAQLSRGLTVAFLPSLLRCRVLLAFSSLGASTAARSQFGCFVPPGKVRLVSSGVGVSSLFPG